MIVSENIKFLCLNLKKSYKKSYRIYIWKKVIKCLWRRLYSFWNRWTTTKQTKINFLCLNLKILRNENIHNKLFRVTLDHYCVKIFTYTVYQHHTNYNMFLLNWVAGRERRGVRNTTFYSKGKIINFIIY